MGSLLRYRRLYITFPHYHYSSLLIATGEMHRGPSLWPPNTMELITSTILVLPGPKLLPPLLHERITRIATRSHKITTYLWGSSNLAMSLISSHLAIEMAMATMSKMTMATTNWEITSMNIVINPDEWWQPQLDFNWSLSTWTTSRWYSKISKPDRMTWAWWLRTHHSQKIFGPYRHPKDLECLTLDIMKKRLTPRMTSTSSRDKWSSTLF